MVSSMTAIDVAQVDLANPFHDMAQCSDVRIAHVLELFTARIAIEQKSDGASALQAAAGAVGLSVSRLRHLFRCHTGISPIQFQKQLRLAKARALFQGSFLSIKEVVAAVGPGDMSHFVRDYKLKYGETPSQTKARRAACLPTWMQP
jgi:transcriptional regulator GlxA family with amidase domain